MQQCPNGTRKAWRELGRGAKPCVMWSPGIEEAVSVPTVESVADVCNVAKVSKMYRVRRRAPLPRARAPVETSRVALYGVKLHCAANRMLIAADCCCARPSPHAAPGGEQARPAGPLHRDGRALRRLPRLRSAAGPRPRRRVGPVGRLRHVRRARAQVRRGGEPDGGGARARHAHGLGPPPIRRVRALVREATAISLRMACAHTTPVGYPCPGADPMTPGAKPAAAAALLPQGQAGAGPAAPEAALAARSGGFLPAWGARDTATRPAASAAPTLRLKPIPQLQHTSHRSALIAHTRLKHVVRFQSQSHRARCVSIS